MGGGSKQPDHITQVNKVELSPEQRKMFNLAFPMAKDYASKPLEVYGGQGVAGFSPQELEAQRMAMDVARNDKMAGAAADASSFLLNPNILSPDSNPFLAQHGTNIADTMGHQFSTSVLPGIRSGATASGGMYSGGSSREGVAQGLAAGELSRNTGNALTDLYHRSYETGLGAMTSALKSAPLTQAMQMFGPEVMSAVGAQNRMMDQSLLDEAQSKFYLEQQLPFLQAQDLMSMVSGMPGGQGVSTVSGAQPGGPSKLMSGMGGAAMGASLGAMIPGLAFGGPVGAGVGLLAGLLLS